MNILLQNLIFIVITGARIILCTCNDVPELQVLKRINKNNCSYVIKYRVQELSLKHMYSIEI